MALAAETGLVPLDDEQRAIVETVRDFVEKEVIPVADELEHRDEFPERIVEGMKELGLFGCNVPSEYGGLELDNTTFAMIIEELARGWMSVVGPLGTHSVLGGVHQRACPCRETSRAAVSSRRPDETLAQPRPTGDAA